MLEDQAFKKGCRCLVGRSNIFIKQKQTLVYKDSYPAFKSSDFLFNRNGCTIFATLLFNLDLCCYSYL